MKRTPYFDTGPIPPEPPESREFNDIKTYREKLIGKKIKYVEFAEDADEGLVITCDDGTILDFGFSGFEGTFKII